MKGEKSLLSRARDLRKKSTDAELLLWRHLRSCQLEGIKFKRQEPVQGYIVDFVAYGPRLIIEVDGSQHLEQFDYDHTRDACLRSNGFAILRFWNNEVLANLEAVLEVIRLHCLRSTSPSP